MYRLSIALPSKLPPTKKVSAEPWKASWRSSRTRGAKQMRLPPSPTRCLRTDGDLSPYLEIARRRRATSLLLPATVAGGGGQAATAPPPPNPSLALRHSSPALAPRAASEGLPQLVLTRAILAQAV